MLFVKMKNERKAVNASVQVTNVQKKKLWRIVKQWCAHTGVYLNYPFHKLWKHISNLCLLPWQHRQWIHLTGNGKHTRWFYSGDLTNALLRSAFKGLLNWKGQNYITFQETPLIFISPSVSFRHVFQPLTSTDTNSSSAVGCGKPHRECWDAEGWRTEWYG